MKLSLIHFKSIGLLKSFEFTRHSSIVGIPVKNNTGTKECTEMARSIIIPRIFKRWSNPHKILDSKDSNTTRQNTTVAEGQVVFIMWKSSRWKEVKGVVNDNKNHRGQGGYFSSWTQLTSNQRNDEVKCYWNQGYDANSKSSLLLKAKWYDKESWCKLSSTSKIVLRE